MLIHLKFKQQKVPEKLPGPKKKKRWFFNHHFSGANCSTSGEYHLHLDGETAVAVFDRCGIPQEGWDGDIYLQRQLSSRWNKDGGLSGCRKSIREVSK